VLGRSRGIVDLNDGFLFFEKRIRISSGMNFFGDRGFPPCSPRGRVDSETTESILPGCYENEALNTVVFFIDEIGKNLQSLEAF
jgi:hypothetical protein